MNAKFMDISATADYIGPGAIEVPLVDVYKTDTSTNVVPEKSAPPGCVPTAAYPPTRGSQRGSRRLLTRARRFSKTGS